MAHHSASTMSRAQFIRLLGGAAMGVSSIGALSALVGCSPSESPEAGPGEHLVTDWMDRAIAVPESPVGVAALDAFCGEIMLTIGAGDQLTAIQRGTRDNVVLALAYPGLDDLPNFMLDGSVNVETLLESGTDVVLTKESVFNTPGETDKLEKTGIPYVIVDFQNIDQQLDAIDLVGKVAGGEGATRAQSLVGYYRDVLADVERRARGIPEADRLRVYHSLNVAVKTDGERAIGSDWIGRVGAVNVAVGSKGAKGQRDYQTSIEEVFVWDPDVIICNDPDTTRYFLSDSQWSGLRAVRERRVFQIPVGATRWGHMGSFEIPMAMLWLGTTIYPELYSDVDFRQEVNAFYRDHLRIEVTDELYASMLAATNMRGDKE